MVISFITSNDDKFKEFKEFIPNLEKASLEIPEVQSLDSKEVVKHKLDYASKLISGPIIVEDTSLSLICLNGLPGTFIKYFEQSIEIAGVYDLCTKYEDFNATATTTIGFKGADNKIYYYDAKIKGEIVEPKGANGFSWDKIFIADGLDKTFAELDSNTKLFYSMRTAALVKLVNALHVI